MLALRGKLGSHETLHMTAAAEIRTGRRGGDTGPRGIDYNVLTMQNMGDNFFQPYSVSSLGGSSEITYEKELSTKLFWHLHVKNQAKEKETNKQKSKNLIHV